MTPTTAIRRQGREIAYGLLGLPAGIVCFTWTVTAWSTSASLAILVIGIPVLLATIHVDRWFAALERRRATYLLGEPVPVVYRPVPPLTSFLRRTGTMLADPQTWKDLAWLLLSLPMGIMTFTVAVTAWATVLGLVAMPAWYWTLSDTDNPVDVGILHVTTLPKALLVSVVGIALAPLAAWLVHITAQASAQLSRFVLASSDRALLRSRVETLTESRAGAVDAAHEELARIERDLHDGAQARLVAVAMDLGMAEQKLSADDPEEARRLVVEARSQAREALGELRDLVRGIGPSILRDRGLDAALTALVAGRTPPVDLRVDVPDRPATAVETAAYFVVAEALANTAKHAGAQHVSVRVWSDAARRLVAEVADDGRGGADEAKGGGLRGLRQRVGALDGTLTVTSPAGGPTTIRAELPCAS